MKTIWYSLLVLFILSACKRSENEKETKSDKISAQYGCAIPDVMDKAWYSSNQKAPFFSGLDGIRFPITTKNQQAQKYFNQGMMLSFGFNHAEAARSFYEASRQDPKCAMGYWGFAYVLGPNYNAGMKKDNFQRAFDAVQKAKSIYANCSQKEKDLIDALSNRYSNDTTAERPKLDLAYAEAMRKVYKKYPDDANIGALFAESLMDMHPWDLYKKDGSSQPWTPEILDILKKCIALEPKHAGANHFFIHATEMSSHAEDALKSADLLRDLVPGSGHLIHMPSHTYIRVGQYHQGVVVNQKAVLVDSLYTEACHAQGAYPLAYYPHNFHFIAACATLSGESDAAMEGATATANHAHKKLLRDPAWATLQHYYSIPWYVQVKLGLWDEIAKSPVPEKDLIYPTVIWHYAQGMAVLSKTDIPKAKQHLAEIKRQMKDPSIKDLTIWGINNISDLCEIASKVLEGEIYAKQKKYPESIALLGLAIEKEDALNYDEPPDWFFSVRHHLGAVLVDAGKYQDAIKIYEEDLKTYRENGWALVGLMNAYRKLGDKPKFEKTKMRFDIAWKHADIKIASSRIL